MVQSIQPPLAGHSHINFGVYAVANGIELVFKLRELAKDFDKLRLYTGEYLRNNWEDLRSEASSVVMSIFHGGFLPNSDWTAELREVAKAGGTPLGLFLFERIVGFELRPELVDVEGYGEHWYLRSGMFHQSDIAVDEFADAGEEILLRRYGFELCGRCARGCEKIADELERELTVGLTSQPNRQADTVVKLATVWLDKPRKTGGPTELQRVFVEKLIAFGGKMPHADLCSAGGFYWEDPRKGATNMANRINTRLSNFGELWSIIPEDNGQCLLILNSELKARS